MSAPLDIAALRCAITLRLGLAPDHPLRSPIDRDIKRIRFAEAIDGTIMRHVQPRRAVTP